MGNTKKCRVKTSSLQLCAKSWQSVVGGFFWTTFLEVLGKYPGSTRRPEEQENTRSRRPGRFGI